MNLKCHIANIALKTLMIIKENEIQGTENTTTQFQEERLLPK